MVTLAAAVAALKVMSTVGLALATLWFTCSARYNYGLSTIEAMPGSSEQYRSYMARDVCLAIITVAAIAAIWIFK